MVLILAVVIALVGVSHGGVADLVSLSILRQVGIGIGLFCLILSRSRGSIRS